MSGGRRVRVCGRADLDPSGHGHFPACASGAGRIVTAVVGQQSRPARAAWGARRCDRFTGAVVPDALVLLAVAIVLTAAQLPARPLTGTGVPVVAARTSRPADQP